MGVIVGLWHCTQGLGAAAGDLPSRIAAIADALRAATGLAIEHSRDSGTLRIPMIRERLFDWDMSGSDIAVHGFAPAHPYLWENLDALMTAAGAQRDVAPYCWQANPAHMALRTGWTTLPGRDRVILSLPTVMAARPFDRWLVSSRVQRC